MHIEIIKESKDEVEFRIDNPTIAELMRTYLVEQGVSFVAWKREHPSKPVIMKIQTSNGTVKKAVGDAVASVKKTMDSITSSVKKK